jgi:hypothetical protein
VCVGWMRWAATPTRFEKRRIGQNTLKRTQKNVLLRTKDPWQHLKKKRRVLYILIFLLCCVTRRRSTYRDVHHLHFVRFIFSFRHQTEWKMHHQLGTETLPR